MKIMQPILKDQWRTIALKPDFSAILPALACNKSWSHEINDHHIFKSPDGAWHLWACVRSTPVGRVLAHWEAGSLHETNWRFTGEIIRADQEAGESRIMWHGEEFLQSPFIVEEKGRFYMFYGGYASGVDCDGNPTETYDMMENQICLMTADDGRNWKRLHNPDGSSRLFAGPGAVRDQYITRFNDRWYIYYSGHHDQDRKKAGIYMRTSKDLLTWSDWKLIHYDALDNVNTHIVPESPVVVAKNNIFYLFRSSSDQKNVLVSESPEDFGIGDCRKNYFCSLPGVVAPEIITDDNGDEYITTINDGSGYELKIRPLEWK